MKIYLVYEWVSGLMAGDGSECVDFYKAFTDREKARQFVEEYVNDPEFKWKCSLNSDTSGYIDYDRITKKRFANRPVYTYEEGDPKDLNRVYVEIYIQEIDLD